MGRHNSSDQPIKKINSSDQEEKKFGSFSYNTISPFENNLEGMTPRNL